MSITPRLVKKRKKSRVLGSPIEIQDRATYEDLDLDAKVELIRALIPIGLERVSELLDENVKNLAGERYQRQDPSKTASRYGFNHGSVRLAGQRVPIRVPRVRGPEGEIPLETYAALQANGEVDEVLLRRVLYGISCRNYEAAAQSIPGAIGLSKSTVSRSFVKQSAAKLREFQERDLSTDRYVVLFLDGKAFAKDMMVMALGVTETGEKRFLGFVETDTENAAVLTPFLRSLLDRGLDVSNGILVVIDGAKGLRSAVRQAFKKKALVERCQWHKRENVLSYLSKADRPHWSTRLQQAYNRPTYKEAHAALMALHAELNDLNQSAAASLLEGLEETLTLHRLGVYGVLGRSLKTTNCIESTNALVEERCSKVDAWKNSNQKHRWLASALLEIEPRLRRIKGYRHLPKLQAALMKDLKLDRNQETGSKKEVA